MIQEGTIASTFALLPPGVGLPFSGSIGHDLNPDYGTGQNARRAGYPGQSPDLLIRADVTTNFVAVAGGGGEAPVAQIHAVVSTSGAVGSNVAAGLFTIIGSATGPENLIGGRGITGYLATELVVGNHFFIRLNPWTSPMGRILGTTGLNPNTLRYLGIILQVPNADTGAFFSAGQITSYMVTQGDILQVPKQFAYPSATKIL